MKTALEAVVDDARREVATAAVHVVWRQSRRK
jgi:hypothetical protein